MAEHKARNDFEVYTSSQRTEMLPFIPSDAKKILDVGCSVGNFGVLIKAERPAEIWGVEIDAQAAEIASQKIDKVLCGGFDHNLELPEKYFDCIVFNDVLEHMVDPYTALEYAKGLLSENGVVVASIPNVRFFENVWLMIVHKNWEYLDYGILDRTHLRFFTIRTIRAMFEDADYQIEKIQGINPLEQVASFMTSKFKFLNTVSLNKIEDMRWRQFAVVAKR